MAPLDMHPSGSPIFGREDQLQDLKQYIADGESAVVSGLAGVGKSRLVQAASDTLVQALARCAIDCDRESPTSRVLAGIAERFDILGEDVDPADPVRVRDAVLAYLSKLPTRTLIVLDNFEKLWEDDLDGAQSLLDNLAEMPNLSLVVAMRTSRLPKELRRWRRQVSLAGLNCDAAIKLYSHWGPPGDVGDVTDLVCAKLEGVPLAIELVAKGAKNRGLSLDALQREVERILISLPMNLGGDRGKSLEASLQVSTQRLDDRGRRLLALLGVLPAGIAAADIEGLGQRIDGLTEIKRDAERLAELGLAFFGPNDRLETLKPIRDYSAYAVWPLHSDLIGARAYYLESVGREATTLQAARDMSTESPNFSSMAATLPDRVARCEALIRQGSAELDAGNDADARETFRQAVTVARRARDARLFASAALGISGGLTGRGHTLDRADEERLALLREAIAVLDKDDELAFRVIVRLMRELHFDTSAQARVERESLRARAGELEAQAQAEDRLQFALFELSSADPAQARVPRTREVIETALALGDTKSEVSARHLLVSFLLEDGETDAAETERAAARARVPELARQGVRNAALWQDGVLLRARLLSEGKFDEARQNLEEHRPNGDPADSPYRRWLHQNVILTIDTGSGADPRGADEISARIDEVGALTAHLSDAECRKFALSSEDQLADLAYEWWPTWRATHMLLLAIRGSQEDQQAAHEGIKRLARRSDEDAGGGAGPRFGRILRHEYYVQVLAIITLAVERLAVLSGMDAATPPTGQRVVRQDWSRSLDGLLADFQGHVVVPGSGVMNLGSVQGFRAMAMGCAEAWSKMTPAFDGARDHNQRLRAEPAIVRTLVADAEMHRIVGSDWARARAVAAGREAEKRAKAARMEPWRRRAQSVLDDL